MYICYGTYTHIKKTNQNSNKSKAYTRLHLNCTDFNDHLLVLMLFVPGLGYMVL